MLYVSASLGDPECLISYISQVPIVSVGWYSPKTLAHKNIRLAALLIELGV